MTPEAFQAALERGDIDAAGEMLADNVVFRSPAVFEPYEGKAATLVLLKAVSSVFQDFRYVRSFVEEHAMGLALVFEARNRFIPARASMVPTRRGSSRAPGWCGWGRACHCRSRGR